MKSLPFTASIWKLKLKVLQGQGEAQTRRLEAGLKEINKEPDRWRYTKDGLFLDRSDILFPLVERVTPRYHEGEIAYVPEAIKRIPKVFDEVMGYHTEAVYASDNALVTGVSWGWKLNTLPGRFLPAALARWFVQFGPPVPQRVQEITAADCLAEGLLFLEADDFHPDGWAIVPEVKEVAPTAIDACADIWDACYPKHPFSSNPWEMTYRFRLVKRPEVI